MEFIQETCSGLSSQSPSWFHFKYVSLYLKLFFEVLMCPAQGEKGRLQQSQQSPVFTSGLPNL